jgi:hypothetical protein
MIIALCTTVKELSLGGWRDSEICKKYPGSGWMPEFKRLAESNGHSVFSGAEAIVQALGHHIEISDVFVVQEENSTDADTLIAAGGKPAVLYCLESPLYAPKFYENLDTLNAIFPRQLLFGSLGTDRVYFPSFDPKELDFVDPDQWAYRPKTLCTVMSNKFMPTYAMDEKIRPFELHSKRKHAIEELNVKQGVLDIYGKGWTPVLEIPVGQKIQVMRDYRYSLCFENFKMPGYVTEKIIDSLVAGTIPIYLGAPDIDDFIGTECFVDAYGDLSDWSGFEKWFRSQGPSFVNSAQKFLKSELGLRFSYGAFAERLLKLLEDL